MNPDFHILSHKSNFSFNTSPFFPSLLAFLIHVHYSPLLFVFLITLFLHVVLDLLQIMIPHIKTHTHSICLTHTTRTSVWLTPDLATLLPCPSTPPSLSLTHTQNPTKTQFLLPYIWSWADKQVLRVGGGEVGSRNGLPSLAGVTDWGVDPHRPQQAPWSQTGLLTTDYFRCYSSMQQLVC